MIEFLKTRRSSAIKALAAPGPTPSQLEEILTVAARVPDHGKLAPWWFVTFEGETREKFGEVLREAYLLEDTSAEPAKLDLEAEKFLRAPLIVAVISRVKESRIPLWEQYLSAGAACHSLCLAANALGFGANWVTGWPAFNQRVRGALKCDERDNIAGFIYIGTASEKQEDRPRPALQTIVNAWEADYAPAKGAEYGKAGSGLPAEGIQR